MIVVLVFLQETAGMGGVLVLKRLGNAVLALMQERAEMGLHTVLGQVTGGTR